MVHGGLAAILNARGSSISRGDLRSGGQKRKNEEAQLSGVPKMRRGNSLAVLLNSTCAADTRSVSSEMPPPRPCLQMLLNQGMPPASKPALSPSGTRASPPERKPCGTSLESLLNSDGGELEKMPVCRSDKELDNAFSMSWDAMLKHCEQHFWQRHHMEEASKKPTRIYRAKTRLLKTEAEKNQDGAQKKNGLSQTRVEQLLSKPCQCFLAAWRHVAQVVFTAAVCFLNLGAGGGCYSKFSVSELMPLLEKFWQLPKMEQDSLAPGASFVRECCYFFCSLRTTSTVGSVDVWFRQCLGQVPLVDTSSKTFELRLQQTCLGRVPLSCFQS